MAYTARNLVTDALRSCGAIGATETPENSEAVHALNELNNILEQWSIDGLLPPTAVTADGVSVAGQRQIAVGSGEAIDVTAPNKLLGARIASSDQYEMLEMVGIDDLLRAETSSGKPTKFAFQRVSSSLSYLYLYPTPSSVWNVQIIYDEAFPTYTLNSEITLPAGYKGALEFELATILAVIYGIQKPELNQIAVTRKMRLKRLNQKQNMLTMSGLPLCRDRVGDIYTRTN